MAERVCCHVVIDGKHGSEEERTQAQDAYGRVEPFSWNISDVHKTW